MDPVSEVFPLWVIALDYISGVVMWTLIGRTAMGFFLPEDSSFFFMRFFVRSTNPLLRFFAPVTPGFLLPALVPLYVAWFFYMLRFYLMPWLLGYTVMGMLSFPLESEIAGLIYRVLSPQWILLQEQNFRVFLNNFVLLIKYNLISLQLVINCKINSNLFKWVILRIYFTYKKTVLAILVMKIVWLNPNLRYFR